MQASDQTFRNTLDDLGYLARKMPSTYFITEINKQKRTEQALDKADWTNNDYQKVQFTDESQLKCTKSGTMWIRKKEGDQFTPKMVTYKKQFENKIMIWGMINYYYGGVALCRIDEKLNAQNYINQILDVHVKDNVHLKKRGFFFQQDNAPCHSAKTVSNWLESHKIKVLKWPAQSPGLSPIEQVWSFLKDELWKSNKDLDSQDDLFKEAELIFYSKKCKDLIKTLFQTIPMRINQIIDGQGQQLNIFKLNENIIQE
ncbi:hypothetical protein ABPG72_019987 [Tetrahymena utriculariae]